MQLELEFHGSEIAEIKIGAKDELEIYLSRAVVVLNGEAKSDPIIISALIRIGGAKLPKAMPKKGLLADGELYGIPGKALNGKIPVDFSCQRACELSLSFEGGDYSINGKTFVLIPDLSKLPAELKH